MKRCIAAGIVYFILTSLNTLIRGLESSDELPAVSVGIALLFSLTTYIGSSE